ncbi:hypothetical protein [Thermanaeromonas sp.]|nr:hypothetical protein [Thermanaeromonas sp.]
MRVCRKSKGCVCTVAEKRGRRQEKRIARHAGDHVVEEIRGERKA